MNRNKGQILCSTAVNLLFPRRCPVCDEAVRPFGGLICRECEEKLLPKALSEKDALCCRCGKPLSDPRAEFCGDCEGVRSFYVRGCAAYRYRDVSGALYRLKYESRAEYAEWMGDQMAGRILEEFGRVGVDMLTPIPISKEREKKRGYNQAALLAERISRTTGIPVNQDCLVRKTDTAVLRSMGALDRRNKIKNAFIASGVDVKSKIIMLIDDIYTTGATVNTCAEKLMEKGAAAVYCAVLAIGEDSCTQGQRR
jgi:ComF family protein